MEIILRYKTTKKIIGVENSIISLQSDNDLLINNLVKDYNIITIDNRNLFFVGDTVLSEINSFNKYPELSIVYDAIKILDLPNNFLDKEIIVLSNTEKMYLNILRHISKIEEMILFKNIFFGFDLNNQKKIIKLINYLKNNYIVFIASDDVNVLYKISEYSIINSGKIIRYDLTDKIYTNVEDLIKMNLNIPTLSYITYKAKENKNIKLFYSKDVRDIIKDIYKHV